MEPTWQVEEEGYWFRVTARATCPTCGEAFEHEEVKRAMAGPPETPRLSVMPIDGGADLVADGWLMPVVSHRCGTGS